MGKVLTLTKVLRKCGSDNYDEAKRKNNIIMLSVLGAILAVATFFLGRVLGTQSAIFGGDGTIAEVLTFIVGIVIFFIAIVKLVNGLYMSSDLPVLTSMPFSAFQLALARVINASLFMFSVSLIILVPFTIGYGMESHQGISFYLTLILSAILTPLFVLFVAGSLIVLFFTIFRFARNKDLLAIIGVIFSVLLCIGIIVLENSGDMTQAVTAEGVSAAATMIINMFSKFTLIIPVVRFLSLLLTTHNVIYLLLALAVTAAAFCLFALLASLFYLKGALAMQATNTSGKRLTEKDIRKYTKAKTPVKAYFWKELKILRRNPAYMMNCFVMTFIWPIFVFVGIFISKGFNLDGVQMCPDPMSAAIATAIGMFAPTIFGALNYIGITSISREGQSFYYMKVMPMTYRDQIKAKKKAASWVVNLGTTGYVLIGFAICSILGIFPWWTAIYGAVVSYFTVQIIVDVQIMWGCKNPNLSWDNETQVMNTLFPLAEAGIGCAITGNIAAIPFFSVALPIIPFFVTSLCVLAILIVGYIIVDKGMYKYTRKKMNYL